MNSSFLLTWFSCRADWVILMGLSITDEVELTKTVFWCITFIRIYLGLYHLCTIRILPIGAFNFVIYVILSLIEMRGQFTYYFYHSERKQGIVKSWYLYCKLLFSWGYIFVVWRNFVILLSISAGWRLYNIKVSITNKTLDQMISSSSRNVNQNVNFLERGINT